MKESEEQSSYLWAIPKGRDVTKNLYKHQDLTHIHLDFHYMMANVANRFNIKVHYHQKSGHPNHLCRMVLDKGITCMPIQVTLKTRILPTSASPGT